MTPKTKLLIATSNPGKISYYRELCQKHLPHIRLLTPQDLNIKVDVDETGATFEENATLKARAWAKVSGVPAIASDSGILIDALGGAPGIYTSRWAGESNTDEKKVSFLLRKLKGVPPEKRTAI